MIAQGFFFFYFLAMHFRLLTRRHLWTQQLFYLIISTLFPLCQRYRKFRLEFKCKRPFRFLPTGIFGITSAGGPLISVGIFRPKFAVPFLTKRFFALTREFGKAVKNGKNHSSRLVRRSIFLGYSRWFLTGWLGIMEAPFASHCLKGCFSHLGR